LAALTVMVGFLVNFIFAVVRIVIRNKILKNVLLGIRVLKGVKGHCCWRAAATTTTAAITTLPPPPVYNSAVYFLQIVPVKRKCFDVTLCLKCVWKEERFYCGDVNECG
jgi:hypothetical protein